MGIEIGYIGVGESPKRIVIESDSDGSYLHAMQDLVGGYIEFFEPMYGTNPALIINGNGMSTCPPNRAVYATRSMEEEGYLCQMDFQHVAKEGELYTILFGPILAVSFDFDEEGNEIHRDISDEEFMRLCQDFRDVDSAFVEILKIQMGGCCDAKR